MKRARPSRSARAGRKTSCQASGRWGGLIQDEKIEADAAEGIGIEGAGDEDGGAPGEIDSLFGFVGTFGPVGAGHFFEAVPDDALGLVHRWGRRTR